MGNYYVVLPQNTNWKLEEFITRFNAIKVKEGFHYSSENNTDWETVETLRELINKHLKDN